jgi:hypothetical protein
VKLSFNRNRLVAGGVDDEGVWCESGGMDVDVLRRQCFHELCSRRPQAAGAKRERRRGVVELHPRFRRVEPESIWELKAGMLKKSGLLTLHRGGERFANLGGLEPLKSFCLRAMRNHLDPLRRPKGVLLLSPPGKP